MNDECALADVPKPEFEVSRGCFKATFERNDYVADASVGEQQDLSGTQAGPKQVQISSPIADLVSIMPTGHCTVSQLMEICGKKNRKINSGRITYSRLYRMEL